jgi:hypothetical protein
MILLSLAPGEIAFASMAQRVSSRHSISSVAIGGEADTPRPRGYAREQARAAGRQGPAIHPHQWDVGGRPGRADDLRGLEVDRRALNGTTGRGTPLATKAHLDRVES